jgi:hypothetical protein
LLKSPPRFFAVSKKQNIWIFIIHFSLEEGYVRMRGIKSGARKTTSTEETSPITACVTSKNFPGARTTLLIKEIGEGGEGEGEGKIERERRGGYSYKSIN